MKKVLVIGAGPAGSTAARELAKAGYEVSVLEEHPKVGEPVQCTGIVTKALFKFTEKCDSYIVNELCGVRVFAPSGKNAEIPLQEYVICRKKFDSMLLEKAEEAGVQYHTKNKFIRFNNNRAVFSHNGEEFKKSYDILIGADGPFSTVGRESSLTKNRKWYIGNQATIKGKFNPSWFTTHFGRELAPEFFAWAVPESSNFARVGVATQKFVGKHFEILREIYDGKIVDRQAGPIPIYDGAKNIKKENIYLVGDAAGVCKNTTGGGIVTSIWNAKILADSIVKKKNYSNSLEPLRRELWIHQKLRNMLDRFSDRDYERLVACMASRKVKDLLEKHPREFPSKFIWKLPLANPNLLQFSKYALS